MIELRTLGTLELTSDAGRPLGAVLAQPRRTALLCYLALGSPGGFRSRDSLYAVFWSEHGAEQARHALRQALYFLRRHLGAAAVVSRGDGSLGVAPDRVRCDAAEFEARLDAGEPEGALALYRGDLLPGFHLGDAPEYEHWLDAERARLRRRAAEAAWTLAAARERTGDPAAAAEWGRRAAAFCPTDEMALRRLVGLLERAGDRAAAFKPTKRSPRRSRVSTSCSRRARRRNWSQHYAPAARRTKWPADRRLRARSRPPDRRGRARGDRAAGR
jgi:DNA-binding SARP family transcriptional activator